MLTKLCRVTISHHTRKYWKKERVSLCQNGKDENKLVDIMRKLIWEEKVQTWSQKLNTERKKSKL